MPADTASKIKQVAELHKQGIKPRGIAAQLGISRDTVDRYVNHARKKGLLPPAKESTYKHNCVNYSKCWDCARATLGTAVKKKCGICSWADDFTPVKGWDAYRNDVNGGVTGRYLIGSYRVRKCPLFVAG